MQISNLHLKILEVERLMTYFYLMFLAEVKITAAEAKSWWASLVPNNAFDRDYSTIYTVKDGDVQGNFLKLTLEEKVAVSEVRVVNRRLTSTPITQQYLSRIKDTNVMVYNGDVLSGNCESITGTAI